MGKKMSEEVVVSDSDDSMEDAPETTIVNNMKNIEQEDSSSSSEAESSDESSSESHKKSVPSKRKRFVPPSGFRPSTSDSRPSAAITSALSNLEGKQVFHITAPSYLPLSEIKQIAFGKATSGEPVLSHKGVDYGLVEASQQQKQSSETLLVYDEKSNTYVRKPEVKKIKSYSIQEIVRLPGLDTLVPSSQDRTKKQPAARPQPKHLRMRFHPVGSTTLPPETVGSGSESEAEPTFRVPAGGSKDKDRKRKTDEQNLVEEKAKKSKKDKHQSSQPESQPEGRRDKEKKSSKHRDETSRERRARKDEKKKRKGEKAK